MTKLLASVVLSIVPIAACSTSSSKVDIASSPLSGTVDGMPWTFQVGATNAFLSDGDPNFFATFHAASYMPCVDIEPAGPHLIVSVPKQPGDYDFDLSLNMTFVGNNDENRIATDGRIVVDSVTATTVTGGLHGTFDAGNEVNGRFQISICPN
jgi:hypothetical protein